MVWRRRQRFVQRAVGDAFSPVHGFPQGGGVNDPATMRKLLDEGVDGVITDYPDRLRDILAERGMPLPRAYPRPRS